MVIIPWSVEIIFDSVPFEEQITCVESVPASIQLSSLREGIKRRYHIVQMLVPLNLVAYPSDGLSSSLGILDI